ncbi:MAG: hypothetical protein DMF96_30145 [Acidobacteria bacterium]|nr:MAG: hypothetical protein DMF96_30145 [Acidobacteriota bacterium]
MRFLYAFCHSENPASIRVLEKCGFVQDARLPRYAVFPTLLDRTRDCRRRTLPPTEGPCSVGPGRKQRSGP